MASFDDFIQIMGARRQPVDGVDLGLLLADWGPNPGSPADLDGDGEVGGSDIGLVLASWGICS